LNIGPVETVIVIMGYTNSCETFLFENLLTLWKTVHGNKIKWGTN
jgi:hypothetical protein